MKVIKSYNPDTTPNDMKALTEAYTVKMCRSVWKKNKQRF